MKKIEFRKLEPGERWSGVHTILALAEDGTKLARYACPCDWCELWQAARPMMDAAILEMESRLGIRSDDRG